MGFEDYNPEKLPDNISNRLSSLLQIYLTLSRQFPNLFPTKGDEVQLAIKNTNILYDGEDFDGVVHRIAGHSVTLGSDGDGLLYIREVVKMAETDDDEYLLEEDSPTYVTPLDEESVETLVYVIPNLQGHGVSCFVDSESQSEDFTQHKVKSVTRILLTHLLDLLSEIQETKTNSILKKITNKVLEDLQIYIELHQERDFKVTHVKVQGADISLDDGELNIIGTKVSKTFIRSQIGFALMQKSEQYFSVGFHQIPECNSEEIVFPEDSSEVNPNESYRSLQVYKEIDGSLNWRLMVVDHLQEEGIKYYEEQNPESELKEILELLLVTLYSCD